MLCWRAGRAREPAGPAADTRKTSAQYNIYYGEGRDHYDVPELRGRTAHEAIFNPASGAFRCPSSQQGYSPFTTWTRGLAWAMAVRNLARDGLRAALTVVGVGVAVLAFLLLQSVTAAWVSGPRSAPEGPRSDTPQSDFRHGTAETLHRARERFV